MNAHNLWRRFLGLGEDCMVDAEYAMKVTQARSNAEDIKELLKKVNDQLDKDYQYQPATFDTFTQEKSSNASN